MTVKLSDWLFDRLARAGVRHVFMVSGGGAMHLDDSLGQCPGIEYVCTLHEQAAAMAAESYAKVVNDIGVCLVPAGPGGTNATTSRGRPNARIYAANPACGRWAFRKWTSCPWWRRSRSTPSP